MSSSVAHFVSRMLATPAKAAASLGKPAAMVATGSTRQAGDFQSLMLASLSARTAARPTISSAASPDVTSVTEDGTSATPTGASADTTGTSAAVLTPGDDAAVESQLADAQLARAIEPSPSRKARSDQLVQAMMSLADGSAAVQLPRNVNPDNPAQVMLVVSQILGGTSGAAIALTDAQLESAVGSERSGTTPANVPAATATADFPSGFAALPQPATLAPVAALDLAGVADASTQRPVDEAGTGLLPTPPTQPTACLVATGPRAIDAARQPETPMLTDSGIARVPLAGEPTDLPTVAPELTPHETNDDPAAVVARQLGLKPDAKQPPSASVAAPTHEDPRLQSSAPASAAAVVVPATPPAKPSEPLVQDDAPVVDTATRRVPAVDRAAMRIAVAPAAAPAAGLAPMDHYVDPQPQDKPAEQAAAVAAAPGEPYKTSAPAHASQSAGSAEVFDASANADRIARAVFSQLNGRADGSVQLRLDPVGLGELRVELTMRGQSIAVSLLPSGESAQQALQNHLHQLRTALESHGLNVTQLTVESPRPETGQGSPNNQGSPGSRHFDHPSDGSSQQNASPDGQSFGEGRPGGWDRSARASAEVPADRNESADAPAEPIRLTPTQPGSVNVLG